ncbi:MAG: coenzyme F420-0:L-glutamate ligase [Candidatus Kaiserbacteria bacterium]|nr:coenzyme F420-0:L-glutamate ligase [Candidatus Kaiserbacteria bacterium]
MQFIPIHTRVIQPPKDDLFQVLRESIQDIQDGDVVLITSKVVSIHEGRCVPIENTEKQLLIRNESELLYQPDPTRRPLSVVHHALISSAGIDESNGDGYYTLLPEDPFASAQRIHTYLKDAFNLKEFGVIITDSHSVPFRYGALSIAIGCHGFEPIMSHTGREDLFGRVMVYSKTNIPDAIAGGATLVSGECDEAYPIVIARGIPNLIFTERDAREDFFVSYEDDIFAPLFTQFKKKDV